MNVFIYWFFAFGSSTIFHRFVRHANIYSHPPPHCTTVIRICLFRAGKTRCDTTCRWTSASSSYRRDWVGRARVTTGPWIRRRRWCSKRARSDDGPGDSVASASRSRSSQWSAVVVVAAAAATRPRSTTNTCTITIITRTCSNSSSSSNSVPVNSSNSTRPAKRFSIPQGRICSRNNSFSRYHHLRHSNGRINRNRSHSRPCRVTCTTSTITKTPRQLWSPVTSIRTSARPVVTADIAETICSWTISLPVFGKVKSPTSTAALAQVARVVTRNSSITAASTTWRTTMVSSFFFGLCFQVKHACSEPPLATQKSLGTHRLGALLVTIVRLSFHIY